jgi:hypothetical protein
MPGTNPRAPRGRPRLDLVLVPTALLVLLQIATPQTRTVGALVSYRAAPVDPT